MLRSIFNFWFSVEELITVQVTKVPRGEDLRAEVPRRGGEGRGKRLKGGERVLVLVVLVHAVCCPHFQGLLGLGRYVLLNRLWISD